METTTLAPAPPRYADAEYQAAHDNLFSHPLPRETGTILPPNVTTEDFNLAIAELVEAVGQDAVFTEGKLTEYVDPYDIPEGGHGDKVPSAAVR